MSVKDVKAPTVPQAPGGPPPAHFDPEIPLMDNSWCCSSCTSQCEGVPCLEPFGKFVEEAWSSLIYFVQWAFGYTIEQRVDYFYDTWSNMDFVRGDSPEYEERKVRWNADLRALPTPLLDAIVDRFYVDKNGQPRGAIHWPEQRSAEDEPFNAAEREAIISYLARYPLDLEVIVFVRVWMDTQEAPRETGLKASIDLLHALWPNGAHYADFTPLEVEKMRWKHHLKRLDVACMRFAIIDVAKARQLAMGGVSKFDASNAQHIDAIREEIEKKPGDKAFMQALRRYEEQLKPKPNP